MTATCYDKAVASFDALMNAASHAVHTKPVRLIRDSGQRLSSGYRHTSALEAEGFLRRDESGVFLQGTAATRVALNGFAMGHLAPVVQPVLRQLKEATNCTAFFAFTDELDIHIGPFSVGRATRQIRLAAHYRQEVPQCFLAGQASDVTLVPVQAGSAARVHALIIPVRETQDQVAVLGYVFDPTRAPNSALAEALIHAAGQIGT